MYDDLNLEEEEEMYNVGTEDHFVSEGTSFDELFAKRMLILSA